MARWHGGMEFRVGEAIRIPPPPPTLPAHPVRVFCTERPEVHAGQEIRPGQVLLEPARPGRGFRVSPIAGTVRQVRPMAGLASQGRGGLVDGYEVLIEPATASAETSLPVGPPRGRRLEAWFAALRQIGGWADRDGELGLIAQLEAAQRQPPDVTLCVGLDAYPPYPVRSSLLLSFPDDAVLGTLILADLVGAPRAVMLASRSPRNRTVLAALRASCRNYDLKLMTGPSTYPAADPTLAIWSHVPGRRALPHGANPIARGVLVLHPWTAIRVGRWFTLGRFDLARPVFVGWPEVDAALTAAYAIPGQPLASVDPRLAARLQASPDALVVGNPLTGRPARLPWGTADDPPVVADDNLLVSVLPPATARQTVPCIHCGWCAEVCPTRLRPFDLAALAQRRDLHARLVEELPWCIDCGLCSHVCPSAIPLATQLRNAAEHLAGPVAVPPFAG